METKANSGGSVFRGLRSRVHAPEPCGDTALNAGSPDLAAGPAQMRRATFEIAAVLSCVPILLKLEHPLVGGCSSSSYIRQFQKHRVV